MIESALVYYRQMADAARIELYNPIPGEVSIALSFFAARAVASRAIADYFRQQWIWSD